MRKIIIFILIVNSLFFVKHVDAATKVKGYFKKSSGSYVQPHYRSKTDRYKWNNWSSRGNYNPYTGKKGSKNY